METHLDLPAFDHLPVLPDEVIAWLQPSEGGTVADLTLGGAGHGLLIAQRLGPSGHLIGFDQDPWARAAAAERLAKAPCRVTIIDANFRELSARLAALGLQEGSLSGLLADLGVSSPQLDHAERGFSLRAEGPLDMRMSQAGDTAADLIADLSDAELIRLLKSGGDVPRARAVVQAIRAAGPLLTTTALRALCERVLGRPRPGKMHPATLVFQALRIAVNDEFGALDDLLAQFVRWLKPGGRAVFISFHSGEDRRVKHGLRALEGICRCPPHMPYCVCGKTSWGRVLTRKAVTATAEELTRNPRASSAKLRAFERTP